MTPFRFWSSYKVINRWKWNLIFSCSGNICSNQKKIYFSNLFFRIWSNFLVINFFNVMAIRMQLISANWVVEFLLTSYKIMSKKSDQLGPTFFWSKINSVMRVESAAWSKIAPDFTILSGLKIEVTKKSFNKNLCPTYYSSMKKKERDSDDFFRRKFTLKVEFSHFATSLQN